MSRKSSANTISNSLRSPSSSLRKSVIAQEVTPQLTENDDEAERLSLRHEALKNRTPVNSTSSDRRHSLGLSSLLKIPESQMKEHMSLCIKLNIQNKINIKNAFSLEMIDFMTFMVTKRKSEITDLQVASTALDVSTKIYGYRVDNLYAEVLKMAGGLDKQQKMTESTHAPETCENREENEDKKLKDQMKKKRKTNRQAILSTENALKGRIETSYPSTSVIGSGDLCTSDMLYQAILPNHANSGLYHHPYNDIILDVLDDIEETDKNSLKYTIPAIEDCSKLDICSSFSNFAFLNWSLENEPEVQKNLESSQESYGKAFQFDLDASVLSADEHVLEPMNYSNIQEDEVNINPCTRKPEQVEHIMDLRDIVTTQIPELDKPSEYSFIQKNFIHWAGPSYWKIKTFGKVLGNTKIVKTCHQAALKKEKGVVLKYSDDIKSAIEEKFTLADPAKIQFKNAPRSWKEEKITLPEDVHYDISRLSQLYLHPSVFNSSDKNPLNMTQLSENENYDYNNENDISDYCPNVDTNNQEEGNNLAELRTGDDVAVETQMAFTGDNLVAAPKLTQKNFLQYSVRAKKIDMRQLKKTIWNSLTTPSNKEKKDTEEEEQVENTREINEPKSFSTVYKSLPSALSKTNTEALSLPIAFVSLLHLANEKSLKLDSLPDLSDIVVKKD